MATEIAVEVFKTTKEQRREAYKKLCALPEWDDNVAAWKAKVVVRFWNQKTQKYIDGGGYCVRTAAMHAAGRAAREGWF